MAADPFTMNLMLDARAWASANLIEFKHTQPLELVPDRIFHTNAEELLEEINL